VRSTATRVDGLTNLTAGGDNHSRIPQVSADGSTIVFQSEATNLIPGVTDPNIVQDVFVWTAAGGLTNLTAAGNDESFNPEVSANGSTVVFNSVATNLIPGVTDPNNNLDVFVWTAADGLANLTAGGDNLSFSPEVSDDGSTFISESVAANLISGVTDPDSIQDVFRFVVEADTTPPTVTFPQPTIFIDQSSPQTVGGTVTDAGSGVARVEIIGVDIGAAGATGVPQGELTLWGLNGWQQTQANNVFFLQADLIGDNWSFTWDPIVGGTGSYSLGIRAFDLAGNKWPADKAWQALVIISDTSPPTHTTNTPTVTGDIITFTGTATEDTAIRKPGC
jgi:hypothetical protein